MDFNCSLPLKVGRLEKTMGQYSAELAKNLPEDLRFVAFTGPASFREPEIDDCWHPCYIERGFSYFIFKQIVPLSRAFLGGVKRFVLGRFGKFTFLPKNSSQILGITPSSVCSVIGDTVKTNYCHPEDTANQSWLVIDDAKKERYEISRPKICSMCIFLVVVWLRTSFFSKKLKNTDWFSASVITLRWIVNLQWVTLWMLDRKLQRIFKENKIEKVFCVHEMWPWSRLVWYTCGHNRIPTVAFQHASISRTKLWYFPTREELESGLKTPDDFFIFSKKEQELLEQFYPAKTVFHVGCGPRFVQWKTYVPPQSFNKSPDAPVLCVSSIPWWDNEIVFRGVEKLINTSGGTRPIRVRLHPMAKLKHGQKKWLLSMVKCGKIAISKDLLTDDLNHAAIVVGMNSTVLEEGLIVGLPVMVFETNKFLSFATPLGRHIAVEELGWEVVEDCITNIKSSIWKQVEGGRMALGVEGPIFRVR